MENNTSMVDSAHETNFRRSIWTVTWVTLILPVVTGIFLLSFIGIFPFPEVFYPFADYTAVLILICIAIAVQITRTFIRNITQLASSAETTEQQQIHLKKLPFYYFGTLYLYYSVGVVTHLYSLSTLHGFNYPTNQYIIGLLSVIPAGLITALPIFFYLSDTLGRYLAPSRVNISVVPIKLKLIVLGLFVPILIDTLLIMYFHDRTGYFALETIGIWFFLIVIAAVGTFMALKSFKQSLSPFVTALEAEAGDHKNVSIIPQSLDELGILSQRWQSLWERVLEHEKGITESNLSLKSDVQQNAEDLESEKHFINKVLENTGSLVLVLDRDGFIVRFNQACERIIGYKFSEVYNRPVWEFLIPPENLDTDKHVFKDLLDSDLDAQYENELLNRNGERVQIAWNISNIRDNEGNTQFIDFIGIDIGEKQAVQDALKDARDVAEIASVAKTEFLSRMSHELRTPMNAILGFGQLLQTTKDDLNAEQKEYTEEIMQGGYHLLALINEVLDLAKIEEGKFEIKIADTNVSNIIAESFSLLKPQAQKCNISLFNNTPKDTHYIVKADHLRLKQVFINLLSNAIKYNVDQGEVFIEISQPTNDSVRISVRDTGPGIPLEMIDRLFTPFERLQHTSSHAVEGTGIGLALSKRMMKLMHSDLKLENVPGQGCTFYLELPYVREETLTSSDMTQSADSAEGMAKQPYRYNVLFVEDSPTNLRLVSHAIQTRADIKLITAHTAALGLDMAISHLPDLILLDTDLPGINAIEFLRRLNHDNDSNHIPIIAISNEPILSGTGAEQSADFDGHFVKPLDIYRFRDALQQHLPQT